MIEPRVRCDWCGQIFHGDTGWWALTADDLMLAHPKLTLLPLYSSEQAVAATFHSCSSEHASKTALFWLRDKNRELVAAIRPAPVMTGAA